MSKKSIDKVAANSDEQTIRTPDRLKTMQECLKIAAQIRQGLDGRTHSNSTELVAEDRQR